MGVSELYKTFPEQTTTHGVPNIKRVNNGCGRLIWILLTLGGLGAAAYVTMQLVEEYLRYDVIVVVERKASSRLAFPAVTICNANPIRYTELASSGYATDILGILANPSNVIAYSGRKRRSITPLGGDRLQPDTVYQPHHIEKRSTNMSSITNATFATHSAYWAAIEDSLNYTTFTDIEAEVNEIVENLASLTALQRATYGHLLDSMLISCTFNRRACSPQNFTRFSDVAHGNCFTFNSGSNETDDTAYASSAGSRSGLKLMLYVEQDEYIPHLAEQAGIVVTVHDRNTVPLPENDGVIASPGEATRIGLRRMEVERLELPYTGCESAYTANASDLYDDFISESYTQQACISSCIQTSVVDTCGCFHPLYPHSIYEGSTISVCSYDNNDQAACMDSFPTLDITDCSHCTPRCREALFERSVTTAFWPSSILKNDVVDDIISAGHPGVAPLLISDPANLYREVARVDVYYEDLSYETITEVPDYPWQSLLADVGGHFALWIGMSVLTAFEYLELVIATFVTACVSCRNRRRKMISTGIQAYHPSYNDRVKEQLAIIKVTENKEKAPPKPPKAKVDKGDRQRLVSGSERAAGEAEIAPAKKKKAPLAPKKKVIIKEDGASVSVTDETTTVKKKKKVAPASTRDETKSEGSAKKKTKKAKEQED